MTPYFHDEHLTVYHGDTREVMAQMEPDSVHCVVTSPPYWGLRDYGEPGQLGLERTPEEYVANMVAVFREVRRVLRDDGTLWLNLGDSYGAGGGAQVIQTKNASHGLDGMRGAKTIGAKQLAGIPWRVAFALQADGWYLRSDIIWAKPNPMPESVTDRPTKAHEYVFLLSKSARYFYDAEAVAEATSTGGSGLTGGAYAPPGQPPASNARPSVARGGFDGKTNALPGREAFRAVTTTRNLRTVWNVATQPYPGAHFATFPPKLVEPCIKAGCPEGGVVLDPFAGSGTTGMVAQALGRRAVLIDLSMDYLGQLMERNAQKPLGLLG